MVFCVLRLRSWPCHPMGAYTAHRVRRILRSRRRGLKPAWQGRRRSGFPRAASLPPPPGLLSRAILHAPPLTPPDPGRVSNNHGWIKAVSQQGRRPAG